MIDELSLRWLHDQAVAAGGVLSFVDLQRQARASSHPDQYEFAVAWLMLIERERLPQPGRPLPTCPLCGQDPRLEISGGQAFCGDVDCLVMAWTPTSTLAEFVATADFVQLTQDSA